MFIAFQFFYSFHRQRMEYLVVTVEQNMLLSLNNVKIKVTLTESGM